MKRFQIRTLVTESLYKTVAATEQAKFSLTRRFVKGEGSENESFSAEGDKKMLKGFAKHD